MPWAAPRVMDDLSRPGHRPERRRCRSRVSRRQNSIFPVTETAVNFQVSQFILKSEDFETFEALRLHPRGYTAAR